MKKEKKKEMPAAAASAPTEGTGNEWRGTENETEGTVGTGIRIRGIVAIETKIRSAGIGRRTAVTGIKIVTRRMRRVIGRKSGKGTGSVIGKTPFSDDLR